MPRHVDSSAFPECKTADLPGLRRIVGDLCEAVDQLDMARPSGGVISADVIDRLRGYLAKPVDYSPTGAR